MPQLPNSNSKNIDITIHSPAGGCSCKLPAKSLDLICQAEGLSKVRMLDHFEDDAAILKLDSDDFLVSSVDFQNPIVPDPKISGEIAAFNALSDIFACGVDANWAEVILALPDTREEEQVYIGQKIMEGISSACADVGCKIVGGHTVISATPMIGLSVKGRGSAAQIHRKSDAKVGDIILLTKALGTGLGVAAQQVGALTKLQWDEVVKNLRTSNYVGAKLGGSSGVHAITDVTGFGLAGHAGEVASASRVKLVIDISSLPVLPGITRAAADGVSPELSRGNAEHAEAHNIALDNLTDMERSLVCDPQTNGGLLITCEPEQVEYLKELCAAHGNSVTAIGVTQTQIAGEPIVSFSRGETT